MQECWATSVGNVSDKTTPQLLAAFSQGALKMFDMGTGCQGWTTSLDKGVVAVSFDRQDIAMNKFLAVCMDSRVDVFDARTQHPEMVNSSSGLETFSRTSE